MHTRIFLDLICDGNIPRAIRIEIIREWLQGKSNGKIAYPIFIYLKEGNSSPQMIVNSGLGGPDCDFHKNEIHPSIGDRSAFEVHFSEKMCSKP